MYFLWLYLNISSVAKDSHHKSKKNILKIITVNNISYFNLESYADLEFEWYFINSVRLFVVDYD